MEKKDDNSMVEELVLGVLLHCRPFTHHRQQFTWNDTYRYQKRMSRICLSVTDTRCKKEKKCYRYSEAFRRSEKNAAGLT